MNERFIELKDDLKNILTKVNKSPSYYYNNWITKMIDKSKRTSKYFGKEGVVSDLYC